MKRLRPSLILAAASALFVALLAGPAGAQESIDPSTTPVKNIGPTGPITPFGIHVSIATLLFILGIIVVVITVILYMRYAPRFAQDEESMNVVRADRVRLGQELPRRNVDLSQASPVVVAPPALPAVVGAAAPVAAVAPAAAAPAVAAAPAATAPAAAVAEAPPPAEAAAAPAPAAPAPEAPAPAPTERVEVTMDQGVYDSTLAELVAAGTDRRIAEGKARRAGMIAAKKAAGAG